MKNTITTAAALLVATLVPALASAQAAPMRPATQPAQAGAQQPMQPAQPGATQGQAPAQQPMQPAQPAMQPAMQPAQPGTQPGAQPAQPGQAATPELQEAISHGAPHDAVMWTGAPGQPTREQLVGRQRSVGVQVLRCTNGRIPSLNVWIAYAPNGSMVWLRSHAHSDIYTSPISTIRLCVERVVRRGMGVPAFQSTTPVLVHFPIDGHF